MKKKAKPKKSGIIWMTAGLLLLAAALLLIVYNLYEEHHAKLASAKVAEALVEVAPQVASAPEHTAADVEISENVEEEVPNYLRFPNMEMPAVEIDGNYYIGLLEIPALSLYLPVMEEWSYANLKIAPCRYYGSIYSRDMVIAGHNYRSHFANLKDLAIGDAVTFTDLDGNVFSYEVADLEILGATDVEAMRSGDWDLTLFTCTVGGQNRVTIRCVLEEDEIG